jgi:glutamyl-tRNA reductase
MSSYYPIFLNLKGRRCVVVGGGSVAERKTGMLLEHQASVTVISPTLSIGLQHLAEQGAIQTIIRNYQTGDLEEAFLVIAATDDPCINTAIADQRRKQRALVNVVDDPEISDFIVPALVRRGDITIAVSTAGKSPALARKIRAELEKSFGAEYASLVRLVNEVRSELKRRGITVHGDDWQEVLDLDSLIEMIQAGRTDEVKAILLYDLKKLGKGGAESEASCDMHICVVGVSHSTTTVAIREKLAISTRQLSDALVSLGIYVDHGIILSTCNRTEIYTVSSDGHNTEQASADFLRAYSDLSDKDLRRHIYIHKDKGAIEHLFRVASGLNSMIIGEYEILGQVARALDVAERVKMASFPLRNLFRNAIRTGRQVREETLISRNALSVSSVAVDLAIGALGSLSNCRVLVIGAGEAGMLVARAAKERGAQEIAVTSRSEERAATVAAALGGGLASMSNLEAELSISDIVISCTGAPHLILDLNLLKGSMKTRPDLPLVVIDIAVPRDVDPAVEQINNVFLYNIDHLTEVSESNRELREKEIHSAAAIIDTQADKFFRWWRALEVRPTVSALVKKAEGIRRRQLYTTVKKLDGLSKEELASLDAMTKAIVKKILHEPIQYLKENPHHEEGYTELVRDIFGLDGDKRE